MKKSLLIAAAVLAVSASAIAEVTADYQRPQGCFYVVTTTSDNYTGHVSNYYAPIISLDPYASSTFINKSQGGNKYLWNYQNESFGMENESIIGDFTSSDRDLTISMGMKVCDAPKLTVTASDGSKSSYQLHGYNAEGQEAIGKVMGYPNYPGIYDVDYYQHAWSSSKYFGAVTNRTGEKTTGTYYWTLPNGAGYLFGKNTSEHNYSGLATAFEAPTVPYLVRAMGVRFERLQLAGTGNAKFTMKIYKLSSIPAYDENGSVEVVPGEELASKTVTVSPNYLEDNFLKNAESGRYYGLMQFRLPEAVRIDCPILVTLTGYNSDAVANFTAYSTTDYFDEGYGELGYIYDGAAGKWMGMNNIVDGLKGRKAAPSIFIETERPLLYWLYTTESGVRSVPRTGEKFRVDLIASRGSETGDLTYEAPDWVKVDFIDKIDPDYGYYNETYATVTVKPFDSTGSRSCDLVFTLNDCARLKFRINQPDASGLAEIEAADDAVKVEYMSIDGKISDKPFNGVNIRVTTSENGTRTTEKIIR